MCLAKVVSASSVEMSHHLLFGEWLEIVDIKTLGLQGGTRVRGHNLRVQFGSDGKF